MEFLESIDFDTPLVSAVSKIITGILGVIVVARVALSGWNRLTRNNATAEQTQLFNFLKNVTGSPAAWTKSSSSKAVNKNAVVGATTISASSTVGICYANTETSPNSISMNGQNVTHMLTPRQFKKIIARGRAIGEILDKDSATTTINVLMTGRNTF